MCTFGWLETYFMVLFPFIVFAAPVVCVVFITILGLGLLLRGASFYGGSRKFLANLLAWLSFVYFVITVISVIFVLTFYNIIHKSRYSLEIKIFANILLVINICWFYITIIYRVYISFKNNIEYKHPRFELIGSAIFVALSFGMVLFVFVYAFYYGIDIETYEIVIISIIRIDIFLNMIILYMLLKRLYRLMVALDESSEKLIVNVKQIRMSTIEATLDHDQENNFATLEQQSQSESESESQLMIEENRNKIEKNRINQTQIVNMMAKVSLLTIISLIFMNAYYVAAVHWYNQSDVTSVHELVLIIGVCWNCLTLYTTFPFNDKQYVKYCGLCHKGVKSCCVVCVTKQMFWQRHKG